MTNYHPVYAGLVGIAVLCLGKEAAAQSAGAQINKVIRDWQARRQIADAVKYEVEGTCTLPALLFGTFPKEDTTSPLKYTWQLHFANNWLRKETYWSMFIPTKAGQVFTPTYTMELYDGAKRASYRPRKKNTSSNYTPSEQQPDVVLNDVFVLEDRDLPVLLAHGLIPTRQARPQTHQLRPPLEARDFTLNGSGKIGEVSCLILRSGPDATGGSNEYWVDPARSSAIMRYLSFVDGKPKGQLDIRYKETQWGWLPDGWTLNAYDTIVGKLSEADDLTVTSLTMNPRLLKTDFQVSLQPGQVVDKRGEGPHGMRAYRVRADGTLADFVPTSAPTANGLLPWLVISGSVLSAFVVAYLARRRMKRKATT